MAALTWDEGGAEALLDHGMEIDVTMDTWIKPIPAVGDRVHLLFVLVDVFHVPGVHKVHPRALWVAKRLDTLGAE